MRCAQGPTLLLVAATLTIGSALVACTPHSAGSAHAPTPATTHASFPTGNAASPASPTPSAHAVPSLAPSDTPAGSALTRGTVLSRRIAGLVSGFQARPALIYLPTLVRRDPHVKLPVLELLHGTPGSPQDWISGTDLRQTAGAFAAHHNGRAPIIVMPDINGAEGADTECVSSNGADVESYLTTDVPRYLLAHFPVSPDRRRWSVAGLSEGGTCALMLALRHPRGFPIFGDLSGLARPTVGEQDDPARTIARLFGGSRAAYDRHDPLWLLAHHTYPSVAGWLECGAQDRQSRHDQAELVQAARVAGVRVHASTIPGGHDWAVWSTALAQMLPWIWTQLTS
jgi:S-formylglutathione hydrolase FrmB